MNECKNPNTSIRCTVQECRYHCDSDHCTLDVIKVGSHEDKADNCRCTDCESFDCKC